MASPTSVITIDADERRNPPRWVRFAGSRAFAMAENVGAKAGVLFAVVIMVPYFILYSYFQDWIESLPRWAFFVAIIPLGFALGLALVLRWHRLRCADLRSIESIAHPTPHQRAIAGAFLSGPRLRPLGIGLVNARAYFDVYRAQGAAAPPIVLQDVPFDERAAQGVTSPQRIVPDSAMGRHAKWVGLFYVVMLIWSSIVLLSLLNPSNRTDVSPQTFFMIASWFPLSLFFLDMCYFQHRRHAVTCFPGGIEYRKWFRRRSLTRGEAVCFVNRYSRLTALSWHKPGRAFPEFVMHFRDPEDPRLQTILNHWATEQAPKLETDLPSETG